MIKYKKGEDKSFWLYSMNVEDLAMFRECFHVDNSCASIIANAHSITENKVLNKLTVNNNILFCRPIIIQGDFKKYEFVDCCKSEATTFRGFCTIHDREIFKPIEDKNDYIVGNEEQEYLFAYRAFAKEWFEYKKRCAETKKVLELLRKNDDENIAKLFKPTNFDLRDKPLMYEHYITNYRELKKRRRDFKYYKNAFNISLDNQDWQKVKTKVIELPWEIQIAASETVNSSKLNKLFITAFPQNGKSYILLSYWHRTQNNYNSSIIPDLLNSAIKDQTKHISFLLLRYGTNIAISPSHPRFNDKEKRDYIENIFSAKIREPKLFMPEEITDDIDILS